MTNQQLTALELADALEDEHADALAFLPEGTCDEFSLDHNLPAAAELRRLHEENVNLKSGYQGACYACEPVGVENQQLRDRIAALEQALGVAVEALEGGDWYIDQLEAVVYPSDDIGVHEERHKVRNAIATARQTLGGAA